MTADHPRDVEALVERVRAGWRPEFLFFWGHTESGNVVGKECLSQWYPSPFTLDGLRFSTAEHFMMWRKAQLFGDEDTAKAVLESQSPGEAKALGRRVRGFDEATWIQHRCAVVERGSLAKFSQHPALGAYLLGTQDRVLVEASPSDRIWGVGLGANDPRAQDPSAWPGLNLLGFALMAAREGLRSQR